MTSNMTDFPDRTLRRPGSALRQSKPHTTPPLSFPPPVDMATLSIPAAYDSLYSQLEHFIAHTSPDVVFIGIGQFGHAFGSRIRSKLEQKRLSIPIGQLDVSLFRDDLHQNHYVTIGHSYIPFSINQKHVILLDVYMNTGRSVRAALNALSDFGCPASIDIGVLFFSNRLTMPVFPKFIGQVLLLDKSETFSVSLLEVDGEDSIMIHSSHSDAD